MEDLKDAIAYIFDHVKKKPGSERDGVHIPDWPDLYKRSTL